MEDIMGAHIMDMSKANLSDIRNISNANLSGSVDMSNAKLAMFFHYFGSRFSVSVDKEHKLTMVYIAGCALSYVSIVLNIIIFFILFRKKLVSPATVLMQGLAITDSLTAFFSYGLEPVFPYNCTDVTDMYKCYMPYPQCTVYTHVSLLATTFHSMSIILITVIGLQRAVAIKFPIWTRIHVTIRNSVICCCAISIFAISLSFPRHFSFRFNKDPRDLDVCLLDLEYMFNAAYSRLFEYSSLVYLILQTILITSCCITMTITTIYIVYKLLTNRFTLAQSKRRQEERRSIIMIVVLLTIFMISEIPNATSFVFMCVRYLKFENKFINFPSFIILKNIFSNAVVLNYKTALSYLVYDVPYEFLESDGLHKFTIVLVSMEISKVFTILGCMSNFIIYISMSRNIRTELIMVFRKIGAYLLNKQHIAASVSSSTETSQLQSQQANAKKD